MPIFKIGQATSNEINAIQDKHFETNRSIREILDTASLDVKQAILSRLPGIIKEMESEIQRRNLGA